MNYQQCLKCGGLYNPTTVNCCPACNMSREQVSPKKYPMSLEKKLELAEHARFKNDLKGFRKDHHNNLVSHRASKITYAQGKRNRI